MNNRAYWLVFSRLRNMLVAVDETASGARKTSQRVTAVGGQGGQGGPGDRARLSLPALRPMALAVSLLLGATPALVAITSEDMQLTFAIELAR